MRYNRYDIDNKQEEHIQKSTVEDRDLYGNEDGYDEYEYYITTEEGE